MAKQSLGARLGLSRAAEPWWAEQTCSHLAQDAVPLPTVPPCAPGDRPIHDFGLCEVLAAFGAGTFKPSRLVSRLQRRARTVDDRFEYLWSLLETDCQTADDHRANDTPRPLE